MRDCMKNFPGIINNPDKENAGPRVHFCNEFQDRSCGDGINL